MNVSTMIYSAARYVRRKVSGRPQQAVLLPSVNELDQFVKKQQDYLALLPYFSASELDIIRQRLIYSAIRLGAYQKLVKNTAKRTRKLRLFLLVLAVTALLSSTRLGISAPAKGMPFFLRGPGLPILVGAMSAMMGGSLIIIAVDNLMAARPDVLMRGFKLTNSSSSHPRNASKTRKGRQPSQELTVSHRLSIVVLLATAAGDLLLSIYRWWPWYTVLVLAILSLLLVFQDYVLPERIARLSARVKRIGLTPTDVILVEMVNLAALYRTLPNFPRDQHWFRYVIGMTEAAAGRAERSHAFNSRVPPFSGDLKRLLKKDARYFSEAIRSHKIAVARVGDRQQAELVCESMCSGIYALSINDWTALAAAPSVSISTVGKLTRVLKRIIPAAILVAASFLLPLLPQLHEEKVQSTSLRIALLVAAVLAVISTSDYASSQVNETLRSSLRWPSGG